MITGGSEASITGLTISGFANIKALSTRNDSPESASRPFDLERDGFVLGEGAATLILEEEEQVLAPPAQVSLSTEGALAR